MSMNLRAGQKLIFLNGLIQDRRVGEKYWQIDIG